MAETAGLFVAYSQLQSFMWCTSDVSGARFRQLTLPELGLAAAGSGFLTSFIMSVCFICFRNFVIKWRIG